MADPGRPSLVARGLTGAVRVYQHAAAGRPSPCRHVPSCSTYAVEALEVHGAVRGSWLAVRRLGRCHPWGTSGYDPVPPRRGTGTAEITSAGADEQGADEQSADEQHADEQHADEQHADEQGADERDGGPDTGRTGR